MSQLANKAAEALITGHEYSAGNIVIKHLPEGSVMILHGNLIATLDYKTIKINFCGYATPTTKRYIDAVLTKLNLEKIYSRHKALFWKNHEFSSTEDLMINIKTGEVV